MKRILLCLVALLLALCACSEPEAPTNGTALPLSPITLPSAQEIASFVTLTGGLPTEVSADALTQAVDARISALLADLRISVEEPASAESELLVRYLGVLQEPLTPKEELEGVLQSTVHGEAYIPVSIDPDALMGVEIGDTDIPLNLFDPAIFSLDAYADHTIFFHVQILAVYRAPQGLSELADPQSAGIDESIIQAEERAKLLWQEAIARTLVSDELPDAFITQATAEIVESYHNLYLTANTDLSFSKWLSLHSSYDSEEALRSDANRLAIQNTRALFAACAILDACDSRQMLPDYETGCLPLAQEAGFTTARFFTWQIGGSVVGWQRIIEAHCTSIFSTQMAS